jgi:hypothetical protein
MIDLIALNDGLAIFKSGMEATRLAFGLMREAKAALGTEGQAAAEQAIELSEKQMSLAEAQIAKGLGYAMCHCQFPPTPMLTVGYLPSSSFRDLGRQIYECPICHLHDGEGARWIKSPSKS